MGFNIKINHIFVMLFSLVLTAGCQTTGTNDVEALSTTKKLNSERVYFPSYVTAKIKRYIDLKRDLSDISTPISGKLYKPEGAGQFPAIVIQHGCSGIESNSHMWASWFLEHGTAALIVEFFMRGGSVVFVKKIIKIDPLLRGTESMMHLGPLNS